MRCRLLVIAFISPLKKGIFLNCFWDHLEIWLDVLEEDAGYVED